MLERSARALAAHFQLIVMKQRPPSTPGGRSDESRRCLWGEVYFETIIQTMSVGRPLLASEAPGAHGSAASKGAY